MKRVLFFLSICGLISSVYSMDSTKSLYEFFGISKIVSTVLTKDASHWLAQKYLDDKPWWYIQRITTHPIHSFSIDKKEKRTAKSDDLVPVQKKGKELCQFIRDTKIYFIEYNSLKTHAVTSSNDWVARVWETKKDQKPVANLRHKGMINTAKFNFLGVKIVTASDDHMARIWHINNGGEELVRFTHTKWVNSAAFDSREEKVITASYDCTARVWDAAESEKELVRFTHSMPVFTARFNTSGTLVITTCDNNIARVWDATRNEKIVLCLVHKRSLRTAQFGKVDSEIITKSLNHQYIWKRYYDYILPQVLLKKLLFLWLLIKKPNQYIDSVEKLFQDSVLLLLVDQNELHAAWKSFEATKEGIVMRRALWLSMLDKIKRYGVFDKTKVCK